MGHYFVMEAERLKTHVCKFLCKSANFGIAGVRVMWAGGGQVPKICKNAISTSCESPPYGFGLTFARFAFA